MNKDLWRRPSKALPLKALHHHEQEVQVGIDPFAFVDQFNEDSLQGHFEFIEKMAEVGDLRKIEEYAKKVEYLKKKRHEKNMGVRKTLRQILRQRPEFRIQQIKSKLGLIRKTNQVDNILKEHKRYLLKKKNMEEDNASESSIDSLINSILEVRRNDMKIDSKRDSKLMNKRVNYSLDLK